MAPEVTKMIFGTKQLSTLARANGRQGHFKYSVRVLLLTIKQQKIDSPLVVELSLLLSP